MNEIIVDDQLAARLSATTGPVTLRTQSGRVLGRFEFEPEPPEMPPMSLQELKRLIADPNEKWYTAAEVEAKLRELRCSQ